MFQPDLAEVKAAVDAAAGRRPGSVLLRRANLLNVLSGERYETDILLAGRLIAAVGKCYTAETEIDLEGRAVAPGLIDAHLHLESSLVEPCEYARAVVPRGVTGVVCDPHEIANVLGTGGIEYVLAATEGLPLDVFVCASSCVPATSFETAGARLTPDDIDGLLAHPRVVGVAELMNFPGVIAGDAAELTKALIAFRHRKVADGHAPMVSGPALNAYLAAGISSDHESSLPEEALEKLRLGATILIREGSAARNLEALLPIINPGNLHQICFCTDDRHPHDLMDQGGVDCLVRRAIGAGIEPVTAVRLGSLNTARHFRLPRRGAVAPGYLADLIVVDDLSRFAVSLVIKAGRLVARDGELLDEPRRHVDLGVRDTVRLPDLTAAAFRLIDPGAPVRAIELVPGEILTREIAVEPLARGGEVVADPARDLIKLAVIERHGHGGRVGVGLVKGFGLQRGAIASTVGHDSHNLLVAGASDSDMLLAARLLAVTGGGFCAVADGQELARLPLPIAGLISDRPLTRVRADLDRLEEAARELGVRIHSPFMALSFLALPVIPALRLTDMGLVAVGEGGVRLVDFTCE
ncbi:MAG TPA: adenine deaminase [Symbiobacteriaceae bacterium]|nr:adenine deaminase [Symbiobacteriaceae bacterium]